MRKKQKKWAALLMLLLAAFLAIPCIQPVQAATPRLNKTKVTLAKGAQIKLKVSGTKAKVKWSADKRRVATVTSKGVVTARGKGVARITAKIGKKKLVCRVTVEMPKLNKSRLTVNVGKTAALKLTGTKGKARWYTTDASIATVTQKGVVRGVRAGSYRVYAKVNGSMFLCVIYVNGTSGNIPVVPKNSYQSIYDTYAAKMRSATPLLVEEYKNEAAANTAGINGLAEIMNKKVSELAKILNDGTGKMATFMYNHGSGQYSEYEGWATKLYGVYEEESLKIWDAYMESAT